MPELKLPDLGENIEEAEILSVLVSEGDRIEKDQTVLELETDKATFELPSTLSGTVRAVHVSKGETIRLGQAILTVDDGEAEGGGKRAAQDRGDEDGGDEGRRPRSREKAASEPGEKRRRRAEPGEEGEEEETAAGADEEGASRAEGESEGAEAGAEEEVPPRGETSEAGRSKTQPETTERHQRRRPQRARAAGGEEEGEEKESGEGRGREEARGRGRPGGREQQKEGAGEGRRQPESAGRRERERERRETETGPRGAVAGPATRRLARELGVDVARVEGSAAGGRVTADDVKAAARRRSAGEAEEPAEPSALPDFERFGPVERRRLTGIERAAAPHLSSSWRAIPHVTQHDVADVTELERMRRRFEENRRPSDPKLAPTALVVKAVVATLQAFPRVNASLDLERGELVLKRYYHIGVAVDTDDGLVVPVVRDADAKTTRQIAIEVAGLAERARARKLTRSEMEGASFTVTNLGGIGGTSFTPIVSAPEVAILGVSRVREEPVVRDGSLAVRLVMPLSLSYDHRAVNGADAARFVRHLAGLLEDPLRLLVES